jgi:hypothetical protein
VHFTLTVEPRQFAPDAGSGNTSRTGLSATIPKQSQAPIAPAALKTSRGEFSGKDGEKQRNLG